MRETGSSIVAVAIWQPRDAKPVQGLDRVRPRVPEQILAAWSEERYPLYAYYASRHLPPAKIRAFLDFVLEIAEREVPASRRSL